MFETDYFWRQTYLTLLTFEGKGSTNSPNFWNHSFKDTTSIFRVSFLEIPSGSFRVIACGQTDRKTNILKIMCHFLRRLFKNTPNIKCFWFIINNFCDKGITRKVSGWKFLSPNSLSKVFVVDKCGGEIRGAQDPQYYRRFFLSWHEIYTAINWRMSTLYCD
jgi:hypothetical protein